MAEKQEHISRTEGIEQEELMRRTAAGRIVILKNANHNITPVAVGEGTRVKINANIGMSPDIADPAGELEKAETARKYGADTLMDLSIGGDTWDLLKKILQIDIPLGTVPVYQAAMDSAKKHGSSINMDEDQLFKVIERQARMGVDFMTVHSGVTRKTVETADRSNRVTGIVSRGGALLARWIRETGKENPLYHNFDYLLEIASEYDIVLSLGDAMRPGSIADSTDQVQIEELILLGRLVERSRERGVGVMVEGPGHVPLNEIEANVLLEKRLCHGAPFYVLGPIVTDIAAGYDHIAGAIGAAVAAMHGADFLCYVTPSEHIGLPDAEDVKQGVIASRIAAHAGDIARGRDSERDLALSKARARLDWEEQFKLLLDPERARTIRGIRHPKDPKVCTMCGEFCSLKH